MPERTKPLTLEGLDDLAKDEVFKFKGEDYVIPALSQNTAEKLAELAKEIQPALDEEDFIKIMKFDIDYIACAMAEGDESNIEELKKKLRTWPRKVLGTISRFIATTMQGPVEEEISEEERTEAKK